VTDVWELLLEVAETHLANDAKSAMYGLVERNRTISKLAGMQGDLVELVAEVVKTTIDVRRECFDGVELLEDCVDAPDGGVYADCKN
jgi:hypothetical protein